MLITTLSMGHARNSEHNLEKDCIYLLIRQLYNTKMEHDFITNRFL